MCDDHGKTFITCSAGLSQKVFPLLFKLKKHFQCLYHSCIPKALSLLFKQKKQQGRGCPHFLFISSPPIRYHACEGLVYAPFTKLI